MKNFHHEIDADGLLTVTWDMPGRSMNVIDGATMDELETIIATIASEASIRGAVFVSAKSGFSGGADLAMLAALPRAAPGDAAAVRALRDAAGRLGDLYRRLETAGKPLVAAIHGACLGGAFELALACHYRIAADDVPARIGLPEAKVGLLPGAGGTQRLPRLIGASEALKLMLRGTHLEAPEALALGAIDLMAPRAGMIDAAKAWIRSHGTVQQPWDAKGFRPPGGTPYSPGGMQMWAAANALYRKETYDNYDAQRAILASVYEGLSVKSFDAALKIERDYFTRLLMGEQSRVMIRSLFHSLQALGKGARRPAAEPLGKIGHLGIVGAGFMGAGIAYASAKAGIDVVLIDRDIAAAEKGKAHSAALLDKAIARGKATLADKEAVLKRIFTTTSYAALGPCDLVIEAVFESPALKGEVWPRIDETLGLKAVRASNTSTLPITGLARHVKDPRGFIGIHFFSPVDKMQLVEVIRGAETSDATLARALDYVRQIGKTPIVVNDSHGFFTSRVVFVHLAEGCRMLEEGVPPAMIENAGRMAGMPVGPLALADEVALDLSWKIREAALNEPGSGFKAEAIDRILEEMVVKRQRFGRKNGRGYYDYPAGGKKRLWPGLAEIAPPRSAAGFDVRDLGRRLLAIQALETARCLAENVLTDVREADVGAILGFGFAPFTGGPLSWIDGMGVAAFVQLCQGYARKYGPRFEPPPLLVEMGRAGETFYGRFGHAG